MFPWIVWYAVLKSLLTLAWLGAGVWSIGNPYTPGMLISAKDDDSYGVWIFLCAIIWSLGLVGFPVIWYWYACVCAYYRVLAPSDVYTMAKELVEVLEQKDCLPNQGVA